MSANPAVLVTGAAKRLGREIALFLAGQGHDIALHYHTSKADAEATREDIVKLGRKCELLEADLADSAQVSALAGQALALFPDCSFLVNNASIFRRGPIDTHDPAELQAHMAVNFHAPVLLTQAFAGASPKPVSVVNLLDAAITAQKHSYFYYLLSKKALADFTRVAAASYGDDVRVNGVCPGVAMASSDGNFNEDFVTPMVGKTTPEEVARAVHAMLTDDRLNGQLLKV